MTPTALPRLLERANAVGYDAIRDRAFEQSKAARECADWEAALDVQDKAPRTVLHYAYTVWDLLETYPDKTVGEFTSGDVERLLRRYPARGRSTRAAHLASFFRYLYKRRLISENPLDFIERPKQRKPRIPEIFSEAEIALLCSLEHPDGQLFTLMFETGMRNSECRKLQRKHVLLGRGELVVWQGKGGKDRIVPLTPSALQAVADLDLRGGLYPDAHLWYTKPGGGRQLDRSRPVSATTFARWYRGCLEAAEVPHRKPHMTRHTRATMMRRKGYTLDEIQSFLGHSSSETTRDLYVHTDIYDVAERMRVLEGIEA